MFFVPETPRGLVEYIGFLFDKRKGDAVARFGAARDGASPSLASVSRARHALADGGVTGYTQWLSTATKALVANSTLKALQGRRLESAVRTVDLCEIARAAARLSPEIFVLDVVNQESLGRCLSEALECPFRRIEEIRRAAPGMVLRASISSATSMGKGVVPRSALSVTADELAKAGIDIVRICDPFNDLDRLVAAVTAATLSDMVVEGALCLDGSLHPGLPGSVSAAVAVASSLERHGCHVIVIEDRSGALRPVSAYTLVRSIRREVSLPVWVRVNEAGGYGLATLLAAIEAGAVGVDTVLPAIAGPGLEPDTVSLVSALHDTERRPEADVISVAALDESIRDLTELLGGWRPYLKPPPDAANRGVSPPLLTEVLARTATSESVSPDQALAACEAAWRSLGQPASVSPAQEALIELAMQMIETGEAGGHLLDHARVDDPQGLLDSVGSLREGGFPEGTIAEVVPEGQKELLELLWREDAKGLYDHRSKFGELELVPSGIAYHGLGKGDLFQLLVDGETCRVRIIDVDEKDGGGLAEINGVKVQIPPSSQAG